MESEHLAKALDTLVKELGDAEAQAKAAVQRVDAIHAAVDSLRRVLAAQPSADRLFPVLNHEPAAATAQHKGASIVTGENPRGREAVRRVLLDARKPMSVREIVAELHRRGWMTDLARPTETVTVTAKRLVQDGDVETVGKRTYRYRLDKLPSQHEGIPAGETGS